MCVAKKVTFSKDMLKRFESGQLRQDLTVTGDECWFYHSKICKANSNASWKRWGEPPDRIVKRGMCKAKNMFCIFFRSTGIAHISFFLEWTYHR